jgi:sulfate adenylyltransferase
MSSHLTAPLGGALVDLMASAERSAVVKAQAKEMASLSLTPRQMSDVEALLCGAYSPLRGFMGSNEHAGVLSGLHLADGTFWPVPVTLDISEAVAKGVEPGKPVTLRDAEGVLIALLHVEEVWRPDRAAEAEALFGTRDAGHGGVARYLRETEPVALAGTIEGIEQPRHYDFVELRATPAELREHITRLGWSRVVAFHTDDVMHRAEHELTLAACRELSANLLIHAAVGHTRPMDPGHYARIRALQAVAHHYPKTTALLSLAPVAARGRGPRDTLFQAVVRQNYGCSHFLVPPTIAVSDLEPHESHLGIQLVRYPELGYDAGADAYLRLGSTDDGTHLQTLSESDLRERLDRGREIPEWFSFPEVVRELRQIFPPRSQQGFTVFFTGLPSSGKSTLANVLLVRLLEIGGRPVTLLDGDLVRKNLSSELGFSREHRNLNIHRIGFVAAEITKNGGIAVCAPIAPYDSVRKDVRAMIEPVGGFLLVHVATPLEVCEQRDRKGLYAKARAGIVKEFTGISDPYEVPADAGIAIDTSHRSAEECVQDLILHLERAGYIGPDSTGGSVA